MFIQFIRPIVQASDPEYEYYSLANADGVLDPNNLLVGSAVYNSVTKENDITIDMDVVGGPFLDLDQALVFYWNLPVKAQDDFGLRYDIRFPNQEALAASDLACCFGLVSDLANIGTKGYGAGVNFQQANLRGWRCKGNVRSVGGLGIDRDGVRATGIRSGGAATGAGNVLNDFRMQALQKSDWQGVNNFYGVSTSAIDAENQTDDLKLFFAVQTIATVADVEKAMKVIIKACPIIVNN